MGLAIGIVGAGLVAERHVSALSDAPNADITAICDIDVEKAEELATKVNAVEYSNHRAMLRAHDLDGVYITIPPLERIPLVRDVARSGAAIFCEKPLAVTVADGREIVEIVEEQDTTCMVGFCTRFCEPVQRMVEVIDDGGIGDPVCLFSLRNGWGIPDADNWRINPDQACGITIESASHNIDLLRFLGGDITTASGHVRNVAHPDIETFDDNMVATVTFESGSIGILQNSWTSHLEHLSHGVIGTEGVVKVEGNGWWRLDRLVHATESTVNERAFDEDMATEMGYVGETRAFLDAIKSGEEPPANVYDGLRALELSHEILSTEPELAH